VKNVREVNQAYEIIYLCTDLTRPVLLNTEERQIVSSILKPTRGQWGHKFFSQTEPISIPVWPGEYSSVSVWLIDARGNKLPCDHLACVIRIEDEP
jgi:hypothetical protein